jgi:predicted TIM-barrel fold metal-dependent hydrolase
MIDFHCHITTPGSHMPDPDGEYYRTFKPLATSGPWMDIVWAETIETVAENWRNAPALRSYRQMSPLIYSEMVRRMLQTTAIRLTLEMARNHVRQACVVAVDPFIPTDEVVAVCSQTKDILLPFGSVDPWAEDWEQRLMKTLDLPIAGFKFHCNLQQIPYGHPRTFEILSVLQFTRFRRPIFLHSGDYPIYKPEGSSDWVTDLRNMVRSFPDLRFVCGHCGWNRPAAASQVARRYDNLWLETSWQPPRILRRICDLLGPQKLVLGSDYPLFSMRRAIRNCKMVLTAREFEIVSEEVPRILLTGAAPQLPNPPGGRRA